MKRYFDENKKRGCAASPEALSIFKSPGGSHSPLVSVGALVWCVRVQLFPIHQVKRSQRSWKSRADLGKRLN